MPDLAELRGQLRAEGYQPGTPWHLPASVTAIDRYVCRRLRCAKCRQRCKYRPYCKGRSYRVLAICRACGWAEEM